MLYVRIFVEIFVLSNRKMYNFRVDFTDYFTATVKFEKLWSF